MKFFQSVSTAIALWHSKGEYRLTKEQLTEARYVFKPKALPQGTGRSVNV